MIQMKKQFKFGGYNFHIVISKTGERDKHFMHELRIAITHNSSHVIRMDNCHKKPNGHWPMHIHRKDRTIISFIGADVEDIIRHFSDEAAKETRLNRDEIFNRLKNEIDLTSFTNTDIISETVSLNDSITLHKKEAKDGDWKLVYKS